MEAQDAEAEGPDGAVVIVAVGAHYRPNAATREEILLHAVAVRCLSCRRNIFLPVLWGGMHPWPLELTPSMTLYSFPGLSSACAQEGAMKCLESVLYPDRHPKQAHGGCGFVLLSARPGMCLRTSPCNLTLRAMSSNEPR